jgi:hypothetical protein
MGYREELLLRQIFEFDTEHIKSVHAFVQRARDGHKWSSKKLEEDQEFWEFFEKEALSVATCRLCGKKLNWGVPQLQNGRKRDLGRPSFDVVDPKLKKLKGNCHIICWGCNRSKSDMTVEEYIEHCRQVAERHIKAGHLRVQSTQQ